MNKPWHVMQYLSGRPSAFSPHTFAKPTAYSICVSACCVILLFSWASAGRADPLGPTSKGTKTEILKDELVEKKKDDGTTEYEETIEIKNKTDEEITVKVTSHPWSQGIKFNVEDGKLVPKEPEPGKWGARQQQSDIKISKGETTTVKFTWSEKFKVRYTDVYVGDTLNSGTSSFFDIANLSPVEPVGIPPGSQGAFVSTVPFPYPRAVFEDRFLGAATSFFIQSDSSELPAGWAVDVVTPNIGNPFTFDWNQQPLEFQFQWNLTTPAVVNDTGLLSLYVVQPDLGYRYHIKVAAEVVPEPISAFLAMCAYTLVAPRGRRRLKLFAIPKK